MARRVRPLWMSVPRQVRARVRRWRAQGETVAFVPTMGALHAGHLALIARARRAADRVIVSLFVNPLQFDNPKDLRTYPRDLRGDRQRLAGAHVDLVFAPRAEAFYAPGHSTRVVVEGLDRVLEGAHRKGHFTGVATVVTKLLHVALPDQLWLGQKDAQQVAVLERMVKDLDFAVTVRVGATVREKDGLAMSSRNARLTAVERAQAPLLHAALRAGARGVAHRERTHASRTPSGLVRAAERTMRGVLARAPLARVDYATLVDPRTFESPGTDARRGLLVIAARFPSARLIDNLSVRLGGAR
jgi:pantoate--beta-alanine ligase